MRAEQLELQQAAYAKQQDKIAHLQKFIDRFKAKASKAKQAQSRVKALERMEKIAPVLAEAEFTFEFKEPANLPNPMLAITDASLATGPRKTAPNHHPAPASTARCWPASASASWAPTARASPRWSRPSPATWRRWPAR
jgi:ATP-binding cassette subfamily F protein 3